MGKGFCFLRGWAISGGLDGEAKRAAEIRIKTT